MIDISQPVTLSDIGLALAMLGAVGGAALKVFAHISELKRVFAAEIAAVREKAREDTAALARDVAEFKVLVAEKYTSKEALIEMEQRLMAAIDRLRDVFLVSPSTRRVKPQD